MLSTNTVLDKNLVFDSASNKLRGGYYTPKEITDFLVKWSVKEKNSKVLEPSCGDGNFLDSLNREFGNNIRITAIEIFAVEAAKALQRSNKKTEMIVSDTFEWYLKNRPEGTFDAVIGNPPFVRYQNFPEEHRKKAFMLMCEEGLSPSRLTNSWLPFVVLATKALKRGGRLGMVLPAELLQVTYARGLRRYLSTKYKNIIISTFKSLVFPGIQQEVVLLMGERGDSNSSSISLLEFEDLNELGHKELESKKRNHKILDLDHDNEKWTQYFLSEKELGLIRRIETSNAFIRLGDIAEVDVGVVTGNNDFFMLEQDKALALDLINHCSPIIGRSNHLAGITFTEADYWAVSQSGARTLLFNPGKISRNMNNKLSKYITSGEESGVVEGYKCRIRLPYWWNVPSAWKPDAFLLRQIHEGPKIISNQTLATSTDTVHRVCMKSGISAQLLAAASINSLTFALSEIRGRSYGGGVLELEPTEAENLLLPMSDFSHDLPIVDIDKLVRSKKTIEALDLVDSIMFKKTGLGKEDITLLRSIWMKLKARRMSRNRSSRKIRPTPLGLVHSQH